MEYGLHLKPLATWLAVAAHFGPLRQRCRPAVPEVDPKWTRNDTLRPTSEPALLRPTSTHFGDIPRGSPVLRCSASRSSACYLRASWTADGSISYYCYGSTTSVQLNIATRAHRLGSDLTL